MESVSMVCFVISYCDKYADSYQHVHICRMYRCVLHNFVKKYE